MKLPTREEVLKRPFKASRQETLRLLEANADLLAALQQAVMTIEQLVPAGVPGGVVDVVLAGARTAIAKAGGES